MKYQDINNKIRKCKKCGTVKNFEFFTIAKGCSFGISWTCIDCEIKRKKQWKLDNLEKAKKINADYTKNNKYKISNYHKEWYIKNKEAHKIIRDKYYKNNKKNILKKQSLYVKKNLHVKLKKTISRRILNSLKNQDAKKSKSTTELLGCSLDYARQYIESLFYDGMSWENHGEWHIDHIMPCISFNLTDIEEQKKCFHYTNLQPLWKFDNLSKGAKIN